MFYTKAKQVSAFWLFVCDLEVLLRDMYDDKSRTREQLSTGLGHDMWREVAPLKVSYSEKAKEIKNGIRAHGNISNYPSHGFLHGVGGVQLREFLKKLDISCEEYSEVNLYWQSERTHASSKSLTDMDLWEDMATHGMRL